MEMKLIGGQFKRWYRTRLQRLLAKRKHQRPELNSAKAATKVAHVN